MYNPKINGSLEGLDFLKWVLARLTELTKFMVEVRAFMARMEKGSSTGARQLANVNINAAALTRNLEATTGVPAGGYRGSVLATDAAGELAWTTPVGGIVPKYTIYLEESASSYEVRAYGAFAADGATERMLPVPTLTYDAPDPGTVALGWPISWSNPDGDGAMVSDPMPIQLEIYVTPHSEGQVFHIELPGSGIGSGGAPWYTIAVYNDGGAGSYNAEIHLINDALTYVGGVQREPSVGSLAPNEYFAWKVDNLNSEGTSLVQPFWTDATYLGDPVGIPLDALYWKTVRALERQQSFFISGALTVAAGKQTLTNGGTTALRIGKVTARVATAPTGSGVQVQAYINGTDPLFTTPLTIAAGGTYAEGVPDETGLVLKFWPLPGDELFLLFPGDFLTFEVVGVGSSTPGSDLTVQVFYG